MWVICRTTGRFAYRNIPVQSGGLSGLPLRVLTVAPNVGSANRAEGGAIYFEKALNND